MTTEELLLSSCTEPLLQSDAEPPGAAPERDTLLEPSLRQLESLIRGVLATPAEQIDDDVVALVRHATKARPKFSVVLALRALRLEQGLREAQQRLIQLQWELAQSRRGLATSTPSGDDDY
jgi:hypothetical protein